MVMNSKTMVMFQMTNVLASGPLGSGLGRAGPPRFGRTCTVPDSGTGTVRSVRIQCVPQGVPQMRNLT